MFKKQTNGCTPWMVFPQTLTEGRIGNFCTFCSLRIFIFRPDRKRASLFALRRFCRAGSAFTLPYDFRPRTASPTKKTTKTISPIPSKPAPNIAASSRSLQRGINTDGRNPVLKEVKDGDRIGTVAHRRRRLLSWVESIIENLSIYICVVRVWQPQFVV